MQFVKHVFITVQTILYVPVTTLVVVDDAAMSKRHFVQDVELDCLPHVGGYVPSGLTSYTVLVLWKLWRLQ